MLTNLKHYDEAYYVVPTRPCGEPCSRSPSCETGADRHPECMDSLDPKVVLSCASALLSGESEAEGMRKAEYYETERTGLPVKSDKQRVVWAGKHLLPAVGGAERYALELLDHLATPDREVVAIELNAQGRFVEKAKALGIPVIIANARRTENLVKAGVMQAKAVIPCTDDELANLDIALDARELNPDLKIVMRMFDSDLARRIEKGFGIHTAFSTSALAAPIFAAASMRVNVNFTIDPSPFALSLYTAR